jgi:hypothetical protein
MAQRDPSAVPSATDNDLRVHCTRCGMRLRIPLCNVGKKCRCPRCNEPVPAVAPTPVPGTAVSNPSSTPSPSNKQSNPLFPPRQPTSPSAPRPVPVPAPLAPGAAESAHRAEAINNEPPEPVTYRPKREPGPDRASPGPSPRIVHSTLRIFFRWIVPFLFLMLLGATRPSHVGTGVFLVIVPAILSFRFGDSLARLLTAAWAPTYTCPGCHNVFESVGRWKCGCGYHDHKDQHFILFRCPMCSRRLGHTSCPSCHATIFLQRG